MGIILKSWKPESHMSPFKKIIIITLGSVENCLKGSGSENGEDGEEMVAVVHARRDVG